MNKEEILNEFTSERIGLRVKKLRCEAKLSVRTLAEQIFIGTNAVYRIEHGKVMPSLSTLIYLAMVLHTSTDYILLGLT